AAALADRDEGAAARTERKAALRIRRGLRRRSRGVAGLGGGRLNVASASRRIWVLNFDADDELSRPASYAPARATMARFEGLLARLGGVVPEGDVVIAEWRAREDRSPERGLLGRAFCPTPRALAALREAGAVVPDAPPLDVLRRVNHRAFSAELGQTLHGA